MRKCIISQFDGMSIDMDYLLCIPSVHATYQKDEIIIDFGGRVRKSSSAFPKDKADRLIKWISLHEDEIIENHHRIGHGIDPLLMINPLES